MSNINRLRSLKASLQDDLLGSAGSAPIATPKPKTDGKTPIFHIIKHENRSKFIGLKGRALLREKLESEIYKEDDKESNNGSDDSEPEQLNRKETLLQTSHKLRKDSKPLDELDIIKHQEEHILEQISQSIASNLQPASEKAKNIDYRRDPPLWNPPRKYRKLNNEDVKKVRCKFHIEVNGNDVTPPIRTFKDMKFPKPILKYLAKNDITTPTQIQLQAIPVVLQGRDLIAVSYTGSGKSLVFILPMIMHAWEFELRLKVSEGEGPFGLILCPSRELASQTHSIIKDISHYVYDYKRVRLKSLCIVGGVNVFEQSNDISKGFHMATATPGRLADFLNKKRITLTQCRYICLDEADRLIDLGFDEEIRTVMDSMSGHRQTLLFSATMPKKIQEFATISLYDPVYINIGRAGAANLNVTQEFEWVHNEVKLPFLLKSLQKSAPPVLIFVENKRTVDQVHEYLLLKGIDAAALHSGLSMDEREDAIRLFRKGAKDVLVATDVASKGLDFKGINHVINYDMPKEIENYVHRIGRTGRSDSKGLSTTFLHRGLPQIVLMDLKTLLVEAKQKVPEFLKIVDSNGLNLKSIGGLRGCAYCSGLGHRISDCPKLESISNKTKHTKKDLLSGSTRYDNEAEQVGNW